MSTTSYYSVQGILTENERATVSFELAVPQLSALNNNSKIEVGTKLELPLWLAEMLAVSKPGGSSSGSLTTLDLPAALGPRVMNALRADPKSVDLRAQSQYFYGIGERMLELFDDDEVAEVLNDTYKQRALEIADKAQNSRISTDPFLKGLDEHERHLFRAAYDGANSLHLKLVSAMYKTTFEGDLTILLDMMEQED